jgi:hypothetical protein
MTQRTNITTYQVTPSPIIRDEQGEAMERFLIDNLKRIEVAINNLDKAIKALEERVVALESP